MTPQKKVQEHGSFNPHNADDEHDYLLKNYARFPVEFIRGEGAYLYDNDGKEYLDFLSGIAVTGFGHNHPEIKSAVDNQLNQLWHVSNLFESGGQKTLASKLAERSGLDYVFFCNSGSEANEAAIKLTRKWGKERSHIITAIGGFHGRTMGSLSATAQFKVWNGFFPLTPGFIYAQYGDMDSIENSYGKDVAAVMIEPIQGENGIILPPDNFLKNLRDFCDEKNILLIFDEIQTGIGRTGKFFAFEHDNVKPDIVTLAKGIANGLPLGAAICSKKVGDVIKPGDHGSTFGGNPLAISSANKVVDLIDEKLLQHISDAGEKIVQSIISLNENSIKEVRAKGLMIGVEFNEKVSAKSVSAELLNNGVITCTAGENVLRLLPPYIITELEIIKFLHKFAEVLSIIKLGR
ncbi:MAG: aspartate aminotransferase family protein [Bacteroidetes bacterium]|nr:aspartate aminotransferase family protein [Bacteroidota bacterium]